MVKYLQMDGVDDKITLPSMTFTEIVIDYKINSKQSFERYWSLPFGEEYFQVASGGVNDQWSSGVSTVYWNGVQQTNVTPFIPIGTRGIARTVLTSQKTNSIYIFANNANNIAHGDIWNIKLYNGTTLVAHYDMSTGTVQDQSGNGKHATLTGGTWLDDGVGGSVVTHDVILSALGKGSATLSMSKAIQSLVSMSGSSAVVVNANKVLSSILAAKGSGAMSISLDGSQLLQLSMSGKGSALISMTKVQTESIQMNGSSEISLLAALRSNLFMSMSGKSNLIFLFGENGEVTGIIELRGSKVINVYLVGSKDTEIQLIGKQMKSVHLRGVR